MNGMEVCVDRIDSAINAQNGGAIRLELCSCLAEGGTTPTTGLLKIVKNHVTIPVYVMIRPRAGDFLYTQLEIDVMAEEMLQLKQAGADGFVFGMLNSNGDVDIEGCKKLLDIAHPLPVTFHRAVDLSRDIFEALEDITKLGFQRILTSGGCSSALEGANVIKEMILKAEQGQNIIIMPGAGISENNLKDLLLKTKAKEFHGSARTKIPSAMIFQKNFIGMGSNSKTDNNGEYNANITSADLVDTLVNIAKNVWFS